jgi:hypothetical protein
LPANCAISADWPIARPRHALHVEVNHRDRSSLRGFDGEVHVLLPTPPFREMTAITTMSSPQPVEMSTC